MDTTTKISVLLEIVITGISFGNWQNSPMAGLFLGFLLLTIFMAIEGIIRVPNTAKAE